MKFKIENLIPFAIICVFVYLFYTNNKTPITSPNNHNVIIQPKKDPELFRTEPPEHDNEYIIKNNNNPDQKLELYGYKGFLLLKDGELKLPTQINPQTGKEEPVWTVQHIKKDIIFDTKVDFGIFCGYVPGSLNNENFTHMQTGLLIRPLKIWNTINLDLLVNQTLCGVGTSLSPSPIKYGYWSHFNIGFAKVMDYKEGNFGNMIYVGFATDF